eukprot:3210297-Lingulodinium_polyedra.AAC.1
MHTPSQIRPGLPNWSAVPLALLRSTALWGPVSAFPLPPAASPNRGGRGRERNRTWREPQIQ